MPIAHLKKKRRKAHEAMAALFPRGERGVNCGHYGRERHLSKAELRRVTGLAPAEVLERMHD